MIVTSTRNNERLSQGPDHPPCLHASTSPALGQADSHFFWRRAHASRPRNLGLGSDGGALVGCQPLDSGLGATGDRRHAAALAVAIGIPAATYMSRATGLKDPQFVVIDEVAGQ